LVHQRVRGDLGAGIHRPRRRRDVAADHDDVLAWTDGLGHQQRHFRGLQHRIAGFDALGDAVQFDQTDGVQHLTPS